MTSPPAIDGVDHLLVGVADLEAACRAWRRLGFTLSPRGRHIGWGTANYCIMFERDYVELLGILDPSQFTNNLDRFLAERGEGLMGLAFAAADAEACLERLTDRGIPAEGPKDLARILELPEGEARPAFRLVFPDKAALPGLSAFVCQHLSRALVWRAEWLRHANGALGLAETLVVHPEPAALRPAYERLLGPERVHRDGESLVLDLGGSRLLFRPRGPAGFAVRVAALAATAAVLAAAGVAFERGTGRLEVDPAQATGSALAFVA